MKLGLLAIATLQSVNAIHQSADIFYHDRPMLGPSMWHFNADGLTIYSPKGDVLKQHHKKILCKPYFSYHQNEMIEDCSYFDAASDGHRYVWAAGHHGDYHHVAAFDIDTGDHAGDEPTCNTPLDLDYLPSRREMWVRCAQKDGDEDNAGEMDVFSSNSIGSEHTMIALNATSRPYGRFETHPDMGPFGYVSSYNYPFLSELDLALKEVSAEYPIEKASGSYAMAYSPVNSHLYVRTRICCSCGSSDADTESCGYGPPGQVLIQTGPNASPDLQAGTCGTGCLGSAADTLGVVEFDTIEKTFIANHNIKPGTGFGADPVASPDGKYILLLPNDGGQNIRVLEPGANGVSSSKLKDIPVNFEGGQDGKMVISDFAFVTGGRNILVLAASTDNDVVLVDLDKNFRTKRINIAPTATESTATSSRQVEWAVGTNYVWVNGEGTEEQYIIEIEDDIDSAKLTRTLSDAPKGQMIFVNNYERLALVNEMENIAVADDKDEIPPNPNNDMIMNPISGTNDTLATAGVTIASMALVVGLVATGLILRNSSRRENIVSTTPLGREKFSDDISDVEAKTLGSKNMN